MHDEQSNAHKKDSRVTLRLTEADRATLEAEAAALRISLGDLIRRKTLGGINDEADPRRTQTMILAKMAEEHFEKRISSMSLTDFLAARRHARAKKKSSEAK